MPDPYVSKTDVEAVLPPEILTKALDDNNDDAEDAGLWDKIVDAVTLQIDGFLAPRYSLPFDTIPKLVTSSAITLAAEMVYDRCGFNAEKNPWTARANATRALLEKVAEGRVGLGADFDPAEDTSGIVTEDARTESGGRLIV